MQKKKTWLGQIIAFGCAFVRGVAGFFTTQWAQFNPIGQALFALAVVMVGVDAVISFKFGWSQTWAHAIGFAGLACAFFILPDASITEFRKRNWAGGIWLAVACVPLGFVCLWTHVGYSSGVRLGDIQHDGYALSAYKSADKSLTEKRTTLAIKTEQLKTLQKRSADAAERNKGWVVTVDPTKMQSSLDAMDTKIANEAKRVRCGKECEKLKVERGQLAAMIDLAKQENDLTGQISTLNGEIEAKAAEVAGLAPQSSTTSHQTQMAAKLYNTAAFYLGVGSEEAVLNPSPLQQDMANTAAAGASSIAFLLVSATLMMAAGFNRKYEVIFGDHQKQTPVGDLGTRTPETRAYSPVSPSPASVSSSLQPLHTREIVRTDHTVWQGMRDALRAGQPVIAR